MYVSLAVPVVIRYFLHVPAASAVYSVALCNEPTTRSGQTFGAGSVLIMDMMMMWFNSAGFQVIFVDGVARCYLPSRVSDKNYVRSMQLSDGTHWTCYKFRPLYPP